MIFKNLSRRNLLSLAAALLLTPHFSAQAQNPGAYPERPVRIVVPFAPGAGTDAMGRLVALKLGEIMGGSFVVDNRAGASGAIGTQHVAQQPADGYTLLLVASPFTTVAASLPTAGYDALRGFAPVGLVATGPLVWASNVSLPVASMKDVVELARQKPGALNYGSAGAGGVNHLVLEQLKAITSTDIAHIPYRGAGPALQDLIAGNVDMMFDGLGSSAAHIKGGRIKALMVAGAKRNPAFPDVPCAAELGLPDYTVSTWYGMWAPKGTPAEAQAGFIDWSQKIANSPETKTAWANNGAEYPNVTGAQFGAFIAAEIKRWAVVVKASGAKLD